MAAIPNGVVLEHKSIPVPSTENTGERAGTSPCQEQAAGCPPGHIAFEEESVAFLQCA